MGSCDRPFRKGRIGDGLHEPRNYPPGYRHDLRDTWRHPAAIEGTPVKKNHDLHAFLGIIVRYLAPPDAAPRQVADDFKDWYDDTTKFLNRAEATDQYGATYVNKLGQLVKVFEGDLTAQLAFNPSNLSKPTQSGSPTKKKQM